MNEVDDDQLLMAPQQIEKEHTKVTNTIMKKNPTNQNAIQHTFQNWIFGNVGTLNIHIHKS